MIVRLYVSIYLHIYIYTRIRDGLASQLWRPPCVAESARSGLEKPVFTGLNGMIVTWTAMENYDLTSKKVEPTMEDL